MKSKIFGLIMALFFIFYFIKMMPQKEIVYIAKVEAVATSTVEISIKNENLSVKEIIKLKAEKYGLDPKMLDQIILCESTYRTNVTHDGGRGKGPTGYHKATFNEVALIYTSKTGQKLNYDSAFDQIELMAFDFQRGEKYRFKWTSYARYSEYGTCEMNKIKQILAKK